MKIMKILTAVGTSLLLVGSFTLAQATSTDVVLNLEGNPTCSSLGDNSAVLELRDNSPSSSESLTLPTPDGSQTVYYEASFGSGNTNAKVDEWRITSVTDNGIIYGETDELFPDKVYPINYIILKAQNGNKGGRVFHFGSAADGDGAVADTNEEVPGPNINAISFCYGLTKGIDEPDPPMVLADLPDCRDLAPSTGDPGDLFTTGIICPDLEIDPDTGLPNEQLIINMALNDPQFGFNFINNLAVRACTCNTELKPCNPDLPAQLVNGSGQYLDQNGDVIFDGNIPVTADSLSVENRTCMEFSAGSGGIPTGVNENVPFVIQGVENPDSYICYTSGGTRYCYGHY